METEESDSPAVRIPPPLIFAAALALGIWADRFLPAVLEPGVAATAIRLIGVAGLIGGIALIGAALARFRKAGTRPEPWQPASRFVAEGAYRRTRNPMYLGMALVQLGIGLALLSLGTLLTLPAAMLAIRLYVIRREEAYLHRRFGDEYRRYQAQVPRWFSLRG